MIGTLLFLAAIGAFDRKTVIKEEHHYHNQEDDYNEDIKPNRFRYEEPSEAEKKNTEKYANLAREEENKFVLENPRFKNSEARICYGKMSDKKFEKAFDKWCKKEQNKINKEYFDNLVKSTMEKSNGN